MTARPVMLGADPKKRSLVIPGEPFALKRARAFRMGAGVRFHDDPRNVSWKGSAIVLMRASMAGAAPATGPVRLSVVARFACPKGDERKRDPRPERWSLSQKDADNILKAVGDAGNGVLWNDDRQVVEAHVVKRIAAQGCPAETVIVWEEIEP